MHVCVMECVHGKSFSLCLHNQLSENIACYMFRTCITYVPYMYYIRYVHVLHMFRTCITYVMYMCYICATHIIRMYISHVCMHI